MKKKVKTGNKDKTCIYPGAGDMAADKKHVLWNHAGPGERMNMVVHACHSSVPTETGESAGRKLPGWGPGVCMLHSSGK